MTRLLDKYQQIIDRRARMLAVGCDAVGLVNQQVLSPTRAIINGRETLLAGTNNYMGITFDADCIAAGQQALAAFGTGTTGSRIANGTYAIHTELEGALAKFLRRKHCIVFTTGYQANLAMIAGLAGPATRSFSTPIPIPRSMTAARCRAPGWSGSATTMPPTSTSGWRAWPG
jgi:8-amino-7-oxononanoate synthase